MKVELGRLLAADLDNFAGDAPVAADLLAQLNFGVRMTALLTFAFAAGMTKAVGIGTYRVALTGFTHGASTVTPVQVWQAGWGNSRLKNYLGKSGLCSAAEMDADCDGWTMGLVSGTPTKACQVGSDLYLFASPAAGGTLDVSGMYVPAPMTVDGDTPALPEWLHEAAVKLAAVYAASPHADEQEALARLQAYDAQSAAAIQAQAERNRGVLAMTSGARLEGQRQ